MRTNNKLNPHDTGTGSRTRATLVGGERSHHCAIPAPLPWIFRSLWQSLENLQNGQRHKDTLQTISSNFWESSENRLSVP